MAESSAQPPPKPGAACIGCRRRKLKCTREPDGCSNCLKSDLPCVYPAPEIGVKRKRGPYKKDKPPREKHLEDLVKYLEPRVVLPEGYEHSVSPATTKSSDHRSPQVDTPSNVSRPGFAASRVFRSNGREQKRTGDSEDLVKDALIALTGSSTIDREPYPDNRAATTKPSEEPLKPGQPPSISHVFKYWHLFITRVDSLTKVIHGPTLEKRLFASIDDLGSLPPSTQALLASVYYSALISCTPTECQRLFGESRAVLLQRYGRKIEATLADNIGTPELESVQAVVLYLAAIRRDDNMTNTRALFALAVQMAHLIGLNNDPDSSHSPLQVELRRRLWWALCTLESRGIEEGVTRTSSILEVDRVQLPANLFDIDLHQDLTEPPQPRVGVTDMTFQLIRIDLMRMIRRIVGIRLRHGGVQPNPIDAESRAEQKTMLEETKVEFQKQYFQYLDPSRPFDWVCIRFLEAMLIKARLVIDFPLGEIPTKQMTAEERLDLLQASVYILAFSHNTSVIGKPGTEAFHWYARGWMQWHSLAIVIAELGRITNRQFANHAWAVLDPILERWDMVYKHKREEPAWDHVNNLIQRARKMREQNLPPARAQRGGRSGAHESSQDHKAADAVSSARDVPASEAVAPAAPQSINVMSMTNDISRPSQTQAYQPFSWDPQPATSTSVFGDVPFRTGCAPLMPGLEAADWDDSIALDSLDGIDFSAFDAVFGDMSWSATDWNMDTFATTA